MARRACGRSAEASRASTIAAATAAGASLIAVRDVGGASAAEALETTAWAACALVRQALAEADGKRSVGRDDA